MEIITYWSTLIRYAKELGKAEQSGDKERIAEARKKHDAYVEAIRKSDRMIIPRIG